MPDFDAVIGANLKRLRGDTNQADLAEEMKRRGHRWSQATVWAVQRGERSLKLAEARDLAEVLGVKVEAFFLASEAEKRFTDVRKALHDLRRARIDLRDAYRNWLTTKDYAELTRIVAENTTYEGAELERLMRFGEDQEEISRLVGESLEKLSAEVDKEVEAQRNGEHSEDD